MSQYMLLVYEEEVDPADQAEREKLTPILLEMHAGLREGLEAHPRDGDMIYEIARVYARSGRPEEAIAQLEAALAASPRSRRWAADDEALASLRDRPDWPL